MQTIINIEKKYASMATLDLIMQNRLNENAWLPSCK